MCTFLRIAGCIAALFTAGAAALHAAELPSAPPAAPADESAPSVSTLRPVEQAFILEILENGRRQAEIARLAVSQARSNTLRELAQQLVSDFNQINLSLEMLARRKSLAVPIQPASFTEQVRQLASRPGPDFDAAFTVEIDRASRQALQLCEAAVSTARDADVRSLAGTILPIIRGHANRTGELRRAL